MARSRTPQGAITWSISLLAFPQLAVPLYWAFGRDRFHGYVRRFRAKNLRVHHNQAVDDFVANLVDHRCDVEMKRQQDALTFGRLANFPCTTNNKVDLLVDGERAFSAMFSAIESAELYILVNFFIVKDDVVGNQLKEHLKRRAEAGVQVYFLYDQFGSYSLSKTYLKELRDVGVEVFAFRTSRGRFNQLQLNFRNHRKVLVVDGKVAFVGGCNASDENLGRDPSVGSWRDTHVKVEGPAVQGVQLVFVEDFFWVTGELIVDLCWSTQASASGKMNAVYVPSGPNDSRDEGVLFFLQSIQAARQRLWIASPYFIPDPSVLEALKLAALRGVDVRIIIPEKTGIVICHLAAYSYLPEIAGTGIRLYRYKTGEAHQKVCLIDSDISWVGTSNMDNRSMRLNFEGNLVVFDQEFASEIEVMLCKDLAQSELWDFAEYGKRTLFFQATVQLARLFGPIL